MKPIFSALVSIALAYISSSLHAQVPQIINYQGRVLSGATNFNGAGQFKFALVNAAGTTTFWSNDNTSVNGSEPTNAVSLTVSNGLYSVLLGDTGLTNMTAIPAAVFNNSDVRLRVWFNNGTMGSQLLSPDQRVASVGYAVIAGNVPDGAITTAKIAPGAIGNAQIGNGAVNSAKIDNTSVQQRVTGTAPGGSFITGVNANGTVTSAAGNSGTITGVTASTGLTGGGSSGNVTLSIANGGVTGLQIANGAVGSAQISDGSIAAIDIAGSQVVKNLNGLTDSLTLAAGSNVSITPSGNTLTIASSGGAFSLNGTSAYYNGGNVGIGTNSPVSKLNIISDPNGLPPRLTSSGTTSFAAGLDLYLGQTGKGYIGVPDSAAGFAPGEMLVFGGPNTPLSLWANQARVLTIGTNGNVGIGTNSPQLLLDVNGSIHVGSYSANGTPKLIHFGDLGFVSIGENNADDQMELTAGKFVFNNGNVGIGTNVPSKKLEVVGDTQITGQLGVNHVISGITMLVKQIPGDIYTFAVESSTGSTVLTVESSPISLTVYGNAYKLGGGSWSATSDQRIKKNIQPLAGALDKLGQLRGVSFDWANPEDHANQATRQAGFLAQEVEDVFPSWVTEIPAAAHDQALTPDGKVKTIYLPFEFDALVVEALRELRAEKDERNAALERQNADLQKRLEKLEQRMNQQEAAAR